MRGSEGGANAHRLGYNALDGTLSILRHHSRITSPRRLRRHYTIHSWRACLCPTRSRALRLGKHLALTDVGSYACQVRTGGGAIGEVCVLKEVHTLVGAGERVEIVGLNRCRLAMLLREESRIHVHCWNHVVLRA